MVQAPRTGPSAGTGHGPCEGTASIHGLRHITPAGRSVFHDLFPPDKAAELEMRSTVLRGLEDWLKHGKLMRARAAKVLGVTQTRLSGLRSNGINRFALGELVRPAARAGLRLELRLTA